ncbi:hypothetical protein VN97_g9362, partial [Penicillium thymicola]
TRLKVKGIRKKKKEKKKKKTSFIYSKMI